MTRRKKTILESRYPETEDFVNLAQRWNSDAIKILWTYVWKGWNSYCINTLSKVDLLDSDEELERIITQDLELDIRDAMSKDEPFSIQHERYEPEQKSPSPARPKQPDLSFVWRINRRVTYPIEAKVLRSDSKSGVREYVEEISENFLKCRYAPFSSEGGMLGYLIKGNSTRVFQNIEEKIPCILSDHPDFLDRDHKVSDHNRTVLPGKTYPKNFRCHHLILNLQSTKKSNVSQETKSTQVSQPVSDSEE